MRFSNDEISHLKDGIDEALAGGHLNAWESKFLANMRNRIERYGTRTRISDKQADKLREIIGRGRLSERVARPRASGERRQSTSSWQRQTKTFLAREARWRGRSIVRTLALAAAVISGATIYSLVRSDPLPIASEHGSAVSITKDQFTVTDGDTIRLNGAPKGTRLVGFNTPETFSPRCSREQELGDRATTRLKELVATADLELVPIACACAPGTEGTDDCNFGRSCATLRADGRDVGDVLISEGLAVPFVCGAHSCPSTPRPWCD